MKLLLLFIILTFSPIAYSQMVQLDSIANYEGKSVSICEKVESTYQSKGDKKTTYLNFGKPFPNATFSVVIFESSLKNFSYNPATFLKGKTVCITGIVKMYKGKPQFVIDNEKQIEVK